MQELNEDVQRNDKKSITQLLVDNSVYDCMPINSYIVSIDKDLSLYETVHLLVTEGYQELLIWDRMTVKWTLLFSLADAIRFTLFAVRCLVENQTLNFSNNSFEKLGEDHIERYGKHMLDEEEIPSSEMELEKQEIPFQNFKISQELKTRFLDQAHKLTVYNFMLEVYDVQNFQLKTVSMDTKLTAVILKMLAEKIHRIVVEEKGSKMYTSILSYKDILLFLLRTVNEEFSNTNQYGLPISVLIENRKSRESTIDIDQNVWGAFDVMINKNKTRWVNVVDKDDKYVSTLFREDFYLILNGWRLEILTLNLRQFIELKEKEYAGSVIPEFRMFRPHETIKQVVEKILLCRRNTLVSVDENNHVEYTIGLSELFNLYIL